VIFICPVHFSFIDFSRLVLAAYREEHLDLLTTGFCNLCKQISNLRKFGIPVVVAVNRFSTDSYRELELVQNMAREAGAFDAVIATHWAHGSAGARELAEAVERASAAGKEFRFLYPLEMAIEQKIGVIASEIYGADGVDFSEEAKRKVSRLVEVFINEIYFLEKNFKIILRAIKIIFINFK
jgi:formyltetrahydrofolate synthetase